MVLVLSLAVLHTELMIGMTPANAIPLMPSCVWFLRCSKWSPEYFYAVAMWLVGCSGSSYILSFGTKILWSFPNLFVPVLLLGSSVHFCFSASLSSDLSILLPSHVRFHLILLTDVNPTVRCTAPGRLPKKRKKKKTGCVWPLACSISSQGQRGRTDEFSFRLQVV